MYDFLKKAQRIFPVYLPNGTYNLHAESIRPSFTGGSGVGPYSSTSKDVSFKPPHPITPVALGAASPVPIPITPGCVATATFRLDGTGSVAGNCVAPNYLLSVTKAGTGLGTVTSAPAGIACCRIAAKATRAQPRSAYRRAGKGSAFTRVDRCCG